MSGMNRNTGKRIEGEDHIRQSCFDILSTPLASRLMRRDYGSRLFELIDQPMNAGLNLLMAAATAGALRRWEPRLRLQRVQIGAPTAAGKLSIDLSGYRLDLPGGQPVNLAIAV